MNHSIKKEVIYMQWRTTVSAYGSARQPPELMHYGIKSMRWGIRRYQNEDGTLTPAGKERYNKNSDGREKKKKDPNARENWKAKDAKNLSDDELRKRNNRLQAEQNYKMNATPEWKKTAKQWGKEVAKAFLVTMATGLLADALRNQLRPNVEKRVASIYSQASSKAVSSLNIAKRKAAPIGASLIMKGENMKQRFQKG